MYKELLLIAFVISIYQISVGELVQRVKTGNDKRRLDELGHKDFFSEN